MVKNTVSKPIKTYGKKRTQILRLKHNASVFLSSLSDINNDSKCPETLSRGKLKHSTPTSDSASFDRLFQNDIVRPINSRSSPWQFTERQDSRSYYNSDKSCETSSSVHLFKDNSSLTSSSRFLSSYKHEFKKIKKTTTFKKSQKGSNRKINKKKSTNQLLVKTPSEHCSLPRLSICSTPTCRGNWYVTSTVVMEDNISPIMPPAASLDINALADGFQRIALRTPIHLTVTPKRVSGLNINSNNQEVQNQFDENINNEKENCLMLSNFAFGSHNNSNIFSPVNRVQGDIFRRVGANSELSNENHESSLNVDQTESLHNVSNVEPSGNKDMSTCNLARDLSMRNVFVASSSCKSKCEEEENDLVNSVMNQEGLTSDRGSFKKSSTEEVNVLRLMKNHDGSISDIKSNNSSSSLIKNSNVSRYDKESKLCRITGEEDILRLIKNNDDSITCCESSSPVAENESIRCNITEDENDLSGLTGPTNSGSSTAEENDVSSFKDLDESRSDVESYKSGSTAKKSNVSPFKDLVNYENNKSSSIVALTDKITSHIESCKGNVDENYLSLIEEHGMCTSDTECTKNNIGEVEKDLSLINECREFTNDEEIIITNTINNEIHPNLAKENSKSDISVVYGNNNIQLIRAKANTKCSIEEHNNMDGDNESNFVGNISVLRCDSSWWERVRVTDGGRSKLNLSPGKRWKRSLFLHRHEEKRKSLSLSMLDTRKETSVDVVRRTIGSSTLTKLIKAASINDSVSHQSNQSIVERTPPILRYGGMSAITKRKKPPQFKMMEMVEEVHEECHRSISPDIFEDSFDDEFVISGVKNMTNVDPASFCSYLQDEINVEQLEEKGHRPEEMKLGVLGRCGQDDPLPFAEAFSDLHLWKKIGEGVFGEVFMLKRSPQEMSVLKIIPVEGDKLVNQAPQKRLEEVLSELIISEELSLLRNCVDNQSSGFCHLKNKFCLRGRYPQKLIDLWTTFAKEDVSENDCPDMFGDEQMYMALELDHAGQPVESYKFSSAKEAMSTFLQVTFSLAVAENALEFEHRDLHIGNILVKQTTETYESFTLNGINFGLPTYGVKATIIDLTLSRITYDGDVLYCDLSKDPELFTSEGDYQFDIYRIMKTDLKNNWSVYEPITNIRWLDYVLDKFTNKEKKRVKYVNCRKNEHKIYLTKLEQIREIMQDFNCAYDFALYLLESYKDTADVIQFG